MPFYTIDHGTQIFVPEREREKRSLIPFCIVAVFGAYVLWDLFKIYLVHLIPVGYLFYYLGISVIAFIMYYRDKSAATNREWRTSESLLHLVAFIGGWPGALLAMPACRHKWRKATFLFVFAVTILANWIMVYWIFNLGMPWNYNPEDQPANTTQIEDNYTDNYINTTPIENP
ncbi:hypothetical protein DdX_17865 [Ditylenchus destructor]|uniref:DUF1294 domain-containing protein n=1 Tax=Ditylenchus destructor TaxID=166010 RepID=A0AAD4MQL3_9BILA|nr:hypothetical protein DdX_17865 [Ditylenchus destructor]